MCGAAYAIGNSTNLALWRQAAGYLCALTAGLGPVSFLGRWYEHLFVGIFSYLIFLGSISALLYLIAMALERTGLDVYEAIPAMAFFAVIAGVLLHLCWMRCPHCGRHLDRNNGQYCQNCGKRIDWDAKPGKE